MLNFHAPILCMLVLLATDYIVPGAAFTYGWGYFPFGDKKKEYEIIKNYRNKMTKRVLIIFIISCIGFVEINYNLGYVVSLALVVSIITWSILVIFDILSAAKAAR